MTDIFELVRCLNDGLSYSKIVELVGVSKGYISHVATQLKNSNLTPAQALKLEAQSLQAIINPRGTARATVDWESVHKALEQRSMTMTLQYELYRENSTSSVIYSYAHFCAMYKQWCNENIKVKATANNVTIAAEAMEIDFAGDFLEWVDSHGELHKCRVFVACLPYSEYTYAQLYNDETVASWGQGIIEALEYFSGAPKALIMDNAKALVRRVNMKDGSEVQPLIADLCAHYGMHPCPARPRHPRDKNRVEAAVGNIQRRIMARLCPEGRPVLAKNIRDLRMIFRKALDEFNDTPWRNKHQAGSRKSKYEREEKPFLASLPEKPYELTRWHRQKVDKAHCVRIEGHRYSVPPDFTGKPVDIRVTEKDIQIFQVAEGMCGLIAEHQRSYDETCKTHILLGHRTDAEKTTRMLVEEVVKSVAEEYAVTKREAEIWVHGVFEQSTIVGRQIIRRLHSLGNYNKLLASQAIVMCVENEIFTERFLKMSFDELDAKHQRELKRTRMAHENGNTDPDYETTEHQNIRNDYE